MFCFKLVKEKSEGPIIRKKRKDKRVASINCFFQPVEKKIKKDTVMRDKVSIPLTQLSKETLEEILEQSSLHSRTGIEAII